jgi:FlaA1/EpsC-like NDP-sugar epimerase
VSELREIAPVTRAELLVIAIAAATGEQMRPSCSPAPKGVGVQVIPSLHEIMTGHVRFGELREVRIEDLLDASP